MNSSNHEKPKNNIFLNNKIVLGIDFGTSYSVISYQDNQKIKVIYNSNREYLIPSIIHFQENQIIIGKKAKRMTILDPNNTIISIKRLIGHSLDYIKKKYSNLPYKIVFDQLKQEITLCTKYKRFTPSEITNKILNYLINKSSKFLNKKIYGIVLTIPAHFNHIQRKKIKEAAQNCGIKVLRLLNEPTSAAIAYGLNYKKNKIILVYDLGGGTFDVSILMLSNNIFEVLAINGDCKLGGDDFDDILAKYLMSKFNFPFQKYHSSYRYFLKCANKIKISLTQSEFVLLKIYNKNFKINREKFNKLIHNLVMKTIFLCQKTIQQAGIKTDKINEIILVGGSTLIPYVQENIRKFFKKYPLSYINPQKVVAIGAGIHANNLIGNQLKYNKLILLDVLPVSLGIEIMGGLVECIIPCNTTIPISKKKVFTTFQNNQKSIMIHVLQGEKIHVKDCKSLIKFCFKNIPLKPAGQVYISVKFEIDTDGMLNVFVEEFSKKSKMTVQVNSNKILFC